MCVINYCDLHICDYLNFIERSSIDLFFITTLQTFYETFHISFRAIESYLHNKEGFERDFFDLMIQELIESVN